MAILNLIWSRQLFQMIKMLKEHFLIKIYSSTNVIKMTEVISTINQTKKETFLNNMVNYLSNFCVLTVFQASSTMEAWVQIVTNLV